MSTSFTSLLRKAGGVALVLAGWAAPASAQNGRIEISQASLNPPASNVAYVIRLPGSYVLTESLIITNNQRGIQINATNVTLDLNGFSLTGPTNSGRSGIYADSLRPSIVVKNGMVRNWSGGGVVLYGRGVRIQNITVENCGGSLTAYRESIVRDCVVRAPTNALSSSVGIYACGLVLDCVVRHTSTNMHVYAIQTVEPSLVAGCLTEGGTYGIYSVGVSYVHDNDVLRPSSIPLSGELGNGASGMRMDRNRASKSFNSVYIPLGTNIAIRNQTADSTGEAVARCFGPNVSGTGTLTNTSPWANIRF